MPRQVGTDPSRNLLTLHQALAMPKAINAAVRTLRNAEIRSDRTRGWSFRKIAQHHGISVGMAHRLASDVYVQLPSRWHRARLPKEEPLPPCPQALAWYWRNYSL